MNAKEKRGTTSRVRNWHENKFQKETKSILRNGRPPILSDIYSANKIFEPRDRNRKSAKGGGDLKRAYEVKETWMHP